MKKDETSQQNIPILFSRFDDVDWIRFSFSMYAMLERSKLFAVRKHTSNTQNVRYCEIASSNAKHTRNNWIFFFSFFTFRPCTRRTRRRKCALSAHLVAPNINMENCSHSFGFSFPLGDCSFWYLFIVFCFTSFRCRQSTCAFADAIALPHYSIGRQNLSLCSHSSECTCVCAQVKITVFPPCDCCWCALHAIHCHRSLLYKFNWRARRYISCICVTYTTILWTWHE